MEKYFVEIMWFDKLNYQVRLTSFRRASYPMHIDSFLDTARYPIALYIYQEKPPIYKVLSNGEIHDVPAVSIRLHRRNSTESSTISRVIIIYWMLSFSSSNASIPIAMAIWGSFHLIKQSYRLVFLF